MRRNSRVYLRAGVSDEGYCVSCGDVFHDNFKRGKLAYQGLEDSLDEHCFAVKYINGLIGDFTVHKERKAAVGHRLWGDYHRDVG